MTRRGDPSAGGLDKLDAIDLRILRTLSGDGRLSWSDLASTVNLSVTPVVRRIKIMEDEGIIRGYSVLLNESMLLGSMSVLIGITLDKQARTTLNTFEAMVADVPEVMSAYLVSGSQDYLLHAFVRDLEHYRVLLDTITEIDGISNIHTSFVLKTVVSRTTPLLKEADPA